MISERPRYDSTSHRDTRVAICVTFCSLSAQMKVSELESALSKSERVSSTLDQTRAAHQKEMAELRESLTKELATLKEQAATEVHSHQHSVSTSPCTCAE